MQDTVLQIKEENPLEPLAIFRLCRCAQLDQLHPCGNASDCHHAAEHRSVPQTRRPSFCLRPVSPRVLQRFFAAIVQRPDSMVALRVPVLVLLAPQPYGNVPAVYHKAFAAAGGCGGDNVLDHIVGPDLVARDHHDGDDGVRHIVLVGLLVDSLVRLPPPPFTCQPSIEEPRRSKGHS